MMKFFPWIFVPTFLFAVGCDRQPDSQTYHVEVPSHAVWTASGIVPQAGQTLTLNASDRYVDHAQGHDCDPEGIAAAQPCTGKWPEPGVTGLALMARIGPEGKPFLVGKHATRHIARGGELYLGVNDDIVTENSNALPVKIELR